MGLLKPIPLVPRRKHLGYGKVIQIGGATELKIIGYVWKGDTE